MTPGDVGSLPAAERATTGQAPMVVKGLGTGADFNGDAHG
jgi:hypothetical protein